ncbi:MAG: hypothetical protein WBX15_17290 [Thermoanaerobaculia bacterium]
MRSAALLCALAVTLLGCSNELRSPDGTSQPAPGSPEIAIDEGSTNQQSSHSTIPRAEGPQLPPVDQAPSDPTFMDYRRDLLATVMRHDAHQLESFLASDIRLGFGPRDHGLEMFRQRWNPSTPASPLWSVLQDVITHGGVFEQTPDGRRRFWAPYWFKTFPPAYDGFQYGVITEGGVPLFNAADPQSKIVATLDHNIVRIVNGTPTATDGKEWIGIGIPDGANGFVRDRYVRQPVGYRAAFEKRNGSWKMVLLVSGD